MEPLQNEETVHIHILSFCSVTNSDRFVPTPTFHLLEYLRVCVYIHIQTRMIKSTETYWTLYLENFEKSVIFKSSIYQILFHTVILMGFSSFAFEAPGIRLKTPHTWLSHTILLLIPETNLNRLFLILLKAEADVTVSVHISVRG